MMNDKKASVCRMEKGMSLPFYILHTLYMVVELAYRYPIDLATLLLEQTPGGETVMTSDLLQLSFERRQDELIHVLIIRP